VSFARVASTDIPDVREQKKRNSERVVKRQRVS
jgi:hypothetical protein